MGTSLKITCIANYLRPIDIIWSMYHIGSPSTRTVIYSDLQYQGGFSSRFKVSINEISFTNLTSSIEIFSVQSSDSLFKYECECNVYRTCSNGNTARASAGLIAIPTSNLVNDWIMLYNQCYTLKFNKIKISNISCKISKQDKVSRFRIM